MKHISITLAAILLTAGLSVAPAQQQQQQERERARAEVQRTAELVVQFRPLVLQSRDEQALALWRMAETEQGAAESYLHRDRYRLAVKFTFAAREHGRAAVAIVRRSASPERMQRELDRTDALIDRARDPVEESGNQQARDLLDRAGQWQEQARAAFRERRFLPAVKLGLAARDLVLRAWEEARGSASAELLGRALNETDELINEWTEAIRQSDSNEARALLDQAVARQEAARTHERAGRRPAALSETNTARRLIRRAIEIVEAAE